MTASFSTARAGVRVALVALVALCGSCDGVGATHAESEGTAQGQDDCVTASSSSPGAPKGHAITVTDGKLQVPADPVIPYIEGDGIGPFIWAAAQKVIDAAVAKAYKGTRAIDWRKLEGGEQGLPEQTLTDFDKYIVGIKGPLGTPVGGGRRSLNVELRQKLDLYVCLRPVRYYDGVPAPVKHPERVDMVIFRENTEDLYAGIEFELGSADNTRFQSMFAASFPDQFAKLKFPATVAFGIKPVSKEGSERLIRAAFEYAVAHQRRSVTLVHKGNIMKFTEGAFEKWGKALAAAEFPQVAVNDVIADAMLQAALLTPEKFDVVATLNLNGDYLSDALAAQVGGIGIAPGGNINYKTGHAIFEATHGTAPTMVVNGTAGLANPSSLILSGEMMLRYMGWVEAADLIDQGIREAIRKKRVTPDFADPMRAEGATDVTSVSALDFAAEIIGDMPQMP